VDETRAVSHLGGFVPGGDEATYYPDLWDWIVDKRGLGAHKVLDVGSGDGVAVKHFREAGALCKGIDGAVQNEFVQLHDFTTGPVDFVSQVDVVWSCEFVEHVEERYLPWILDAFQKGAVVLMTHAFPGQGGHHHVNCQRPEYWLGAMASVGYFKDQELTDITRSLAAVNPSPWNHYVRSGMAFRRYS
jgi:cyclopropane fatty-acyl-phospholipid synthase-like methyltransferase